MRPYLAAQAIEPSPQTGPPATKTGPNGRLLPATTKTLHGPSKGGDRAAALAACTLILRRPDFAANRLFSQFVLRFNRKLQERSPNPRRSRRIFARLTVSNRPETCF